MWHVGDCGVRVVGQMSRYIGMGVRKGTVVTGVGVVRSYLVLLLLGSPSLYVFSFFSPDQCSNIGLGTSLIPIIYIIWNTIATVLHNIASVFSVVTLIV